MVKNASSELVAFHVPRIPVLSREHPLRCYPSTPDERNQLAFYLHSEWCTGARKCSIQIGSGLAQPNTIGFGTLVLGFMHSDQMQRRSPARRLRRRAAACVPLVLESSLKFALELYGQRRQCTMGDDHLFKKGLT